MEEQDVAYLFVIEVDEAGTHVSSVVVYTGLKAETFFFFAHSSMSL